VAEPIRKTDFWADAMEAALYLEIVHRNPRRDGETPLAYVVRLSEATQAEMAAEAARVPQPQPSAELADQRDAANW
jgi:hypothetical protein